jgi:hypothetical protein
MEIKECEHLSELPVYYEGPGYLNCPNMQPSENDTSMTREHYDCKVCGRHRSIDYDEIR